MKQTNGAASRPKDTQDSNPDAWLRRLARYCWRHKRSMLLSLAGALAATLATAAIPLILGLIVDDTILTPRRAGLGRCARADRRGPGELRRRVHPPVRGRQAVAGRPARHADRVVRGAGRAGRRPAGPAAHRPGGEPGHLRPEHGPGAARHAADAAGQRAAVRAVGHDHGVPVPVADAGRAGHRARAVAHRAALPAPAVPGQLGRPAAGRERGRGGRGRGHRGPGGQGLRPGGAGDRASWRTPAARCSRPGCAPSG